MECNFTYRHYREFVSLARSHGFSFFGLYDYLVHKPKGKLILMRHDVDLSMSHALKMAKIENSLGIKAAYFVRTAKTVNPFSKKNSAMLKKIAKLGHEIGLHYDSDVVNKKNFTGYLLKMKKKLESAAGKKIHGTALHRVKMLSGKKEITELNFMERFLGRLGMDYDAHSKSFESLKYISDSARQWKNGCICKNLNSSQSMYLLTHPIWWSDATTSLVTIIEGLM